jgi:hypothetical protein
MRHLFSLHFSSTQHLRHDATAARFFLFPLLFACATRRKGQTPYTHAHSLSHSYEPIFPLPPLALASSFMPVGYMINNSVTGVLVNTLREQVNAWGIRLGGEAKMGRSNNILC